jgi:hypothetical protein
MTAHYLERLDEMPEEQQPIESTTGYLLLLMQSWGLGWHLSPIYRLPPGCVSVRATVAPSPEFRGSPLLSCDMRLVFWTIDGRRIPGCGVGLPSRPAFEADEPVPTTGHELGQPPGVFPQNAGQFAFVMQESIGVQQGSAHESVQVEFKLSHQASAFVDAAVTIEAFDADGVSLGNG